MRAVVRQQAETINQLNAQLDEAEEVKANLFNLSEWKDTLIASQRDNLRRLFSMVMQHMELFQPLSSINYDQLAYELSQEPQMPPHVKLPPSKYAHIGRYSAPPATQHQ